VNGATFDEVVNVNAEVTVGIDALIYPALLAEDARLAS